MTIDELMDLWEYARKCPDPLIEAWKRFIEKSEEK